MQPNTQHSVARRVPYWPLLCATILVPLAAAENNPPSPRPSAIANTPAPPAVRFTDVTAAAGLGFTHFSGARGEKLLPETMGGGCAFLDYDADGDQDILLVSSSHSLGAAEPGGRPALALYANDGRGAFRDTTRAAGLDARLYGMGVAVGDYDNDGRPDLFITAVGTNRLFHNEGGRFLDVTAQAGIAGRPTQWSTSSGFFDYNRDGRLDLFVCNYVEWSREIDLERNQPIPGVGRVYGPPIPFAGTHPLLYRNDGGGRFTEVSEPSGLRQRDSQTNRGLTKALGIAPVDLDEDGWMDVIVANDTVPNQVFYNLKDGTFKEIGASSGLAYDAFGNIRGAMGIDTAWIGDDGSLGVAIANFANEMNGFYVAPPRSLRFTDEAPLNPVGKASRALIKFGLLFLDYDLDGWPDLLTANGHLDADLSKARGDAGYAQPAQLFWNGGPKLSETFIPVAESHSGPDLFQPIVGRGAAYADIDQDGDLDLLLTQIDGKPLLLRNDQKTLHRYTRMKLTGSRSNRDAIGARVLLRNSSRIWQAQVMPTRSYLSQVEPLLTFGFGSGELPSEMEIFWPSGTHQKLPFKYANYLELREPPAP